MECEHNQGETLERKDGLIQCHSKSQLMYTLNEDDGQKHTEQKHLAWQLSRDEVEGTPLL